MKLAAALLLWFGAIAAATAALALQLYPA